MMKHWKWTALETIAWLRICRPGSIIGHQQEWMIEKELPMWKQGDYFRKTHKNNPKYTPLLNTPCPYPVYSIKLKKRLLEDNNQKMVQHSHTSNDDSADNENANIEKGGGGGSLNNKRSSSGMGGGDAYTKIVTKVEKIKVCHNKHFIRFKFVGIILSKILFVVFLVYYFAIFSRLKMNTMETPYPHHQHHIRL